MKTGHRKNPLKALLKLGLSLSALAAIATAPGVAAAQDANTGASSDAGRDVIVITARRREESLQSVPGAITAFSPEEITERAIKSDADLQLVTPGLTIRQTQGENSLTYSIRGQSADTFSGSPSSVLAYFNEVPLTVNGATSLYDLQSVQVLKGPQGTLFGRNVTGGAVLFAGAKPENEFGASASVRVGNYDLREFEGMVNVPIIDDRVLLRVAVNSLRREGFIYNAYSGEHVGDVERDSGRLSLTVKPTDRIENTTVFQYTESGGTNAGASYTWSVYPCGATNNGVALTCSSGLLFGPGLDTAFGQAGLWDAYLAAHPKAFPAGLLAYVDQQRKDGPYVTRHPGRYSHDGEDWIATNTTTWEVNDSLTVKNILGVLHSKSVSVQPQLGAPFVTIATENSATREFGNSLEVDSISDELQIQGEALGGKLTYIAGLYYQDQESDTLWPQTYFELSPVSAPSLVTNNFRIGNETQAVYAQGTYDVSGLTGVSNLKVTAGLRYTKEKVKIAQLAASTFTFGAPDQSKDFDDPSWEVGLEYQATPNLFTYVKTRGSFRSGGFNGSAPPVNATASGGGNIFESENTQDVEIGLKYSGDAFGRPATLNINVFKQWVEDAQRVAFPDPDGPGGLASIAVTASVPEEEIQGVEADASIELTDWLEVGGNLSLIDAEFTDGKVALFGNTFNFGPVGDTPETSGSAYAKVIFPTSEETGEIALRLDAYTQSDFYFSNTAASTTPDTKLPSYTLANARLSWSGILGSKVSGAVFAKNLLGEEYFVGGMPLGAPLGHNGAVVGQPQTYGLEMSVKY